MALDRTRLLDDPHLAGAELCRALSDQVDAWLGELWAAIGAPDGLALAAVGGYGRAELSPASDIDLLLVHQPRRGGPDIARVAEQVWYPIWDEGLKLGHAVRTTKEALALASDDLDTATALLSTRWVAGDRAVVDDLAAKALALWQKRAKRWLGELSASVRRRHGQAGETAFLLEPDLKDGRGGLRDVHAVRWAEAARSVMLEGDDATLAHAYDTILSARVELHRITRRPGDRLVLDHQDAVAAALGYGDADDLMRDVSAAARTIAWTSDEVWDRVDSSLGATRVPFSRDRDLAPGVVLRDGDVELRDAADPAADPLLALRAAAAAAQAGARIERRSLLRLAAGTPPLPDPWPDEARALFVELLRAGAPAIPVIEALDLKGVWERIVPEWAAVRCKPQRNAYHTFTVDRHLLEVAAGAAGLVERVGRPDLLVVGALFHDLGKGYPGDHTEVGIDVVGRVVARMGFDPADVATLQAMVRHHLLLPDVAVRRDLSDDGTIAMVAGAVGSVGTLQLLDALTEADSLATGPAAWSPWKAELVRELVGRVAHVLGGGAIEEVTAGDGPTEAELARMAEGRLVLEGSGDRLLVVAPDRPGLFSRVAGALSLSGLDVLEATAHSDDRGMAVETFRVASNLAGAVPAGGPIPIGGPGPIDWGPVIDNIDRALSGRLAVHARLAERARVYAPRRPRQPTAPAPPSVLIDNEISTRATVVEVQAPDAPGVLFTITRAMAEMDLDLRRAKIQTMTAEVIDSFYVCDREGRKVSDPAHLAELERAILHALAG